MWYTVREFKERDVNTVKKFLDKVFRLRENNTSVKTELLAGLTTFMTMAYILAVNPGVLAALFVLKYIFL